MLGTTLPAGADGAIFRSGSDSYFLIDADHSQRFHGRKGKGITAGIAIGSVIGLDAMFAGPICGASMNPARSLAPAIVSGHTETFWLYLVAPVLELSWRSSLPLLRDEPGCCSSSATRSPSCHENYRTQKRTRKSSQPQTFDLYLPNGDSLPAHAHVTEVARIDKRFIDCGGTLRNDSHCRLQTWFSDDLDHRLTAGKLAKILDMAAPVLGPDDLEVDVEHEVGFITQFSARVGRGHGLMKSSSRLSERHTACLAPEKCKPPVKTFSDFNPLKFDFKRSQPTSDCCCSTEGDSTMKKKALFICIHNSARSQMAEAFLKHMLRP